MTVHPTSQAPPPATAQANLLDLLDDSTLVQNSLPAVNDPSTTNATPTSIATTAGDGAMSDLSMLGLLTDSTSSSMTTPTMALSLLDTSVSSIQVPAEYSKFPVSIDCENKASTEA